MCKTGDSAGCKVACGVTGTGGSGGNYPTGGSGGVATGGDGGGGATGGTGNGGTGGTIPAGDLATGLSITEVSIFQGVKIQLMPSYSNNAPMVADRAAMIRVYVTPDAGFQQRDIVARVEIGGSGAGQFDAQAFIGGPSSDAVAASTINVSIPGTAMKPDATLKVSLREAAGGAYSGSNANSQWDGGGLGVQSNGGVFHVVLVPVISNGIAPITDGNAIAAYKERLMKLYPASDIDIQVHAPATYSGTAPSASGSGWGSMLNWLMQIRSYDKPPSNSYYYGVVTPKTTFQQYCPGGCVAGLSNSTKNYPQDIQGRVGSGVGFFPQGTTPNTTDTMAHEVGHTLGLDHAPCSQFGSIQGVDPAYPYAGAKLGSWGWDIVTTNFLDPNKYVDLMSYCEPTWISDWSFAKLFNRIAYANAGGDMIFSNDPERAPGWYKTAVWEDGKLEWGYPIQSPWPLLAEKKQVDLLDAQGNVVGSVSGIFYPYDHGDGGILYVKDELLATSPKVVSMKPAGVAQSLPLK